MVVGMERLGGPDGEDRKQPAARAAEILRRYGREIRAMIRFVGCDPSEQEDAFQQLFLTLLLSPPPQDVKDIRAYLYRAILNDQISRRTSNSLHRRHLHLYAAHLQYTVEDGDPAERLEQLELAEKVCGLIHRLPTRQAQAISFAFWSGLDRRQACKEMGIRRQSFAKYLWRGLRVLRQGLRERMGEYEGRD